MFIKIPTNVENLIAGLNKATEDGDYLVLAGRTQAGLEIQVRANDIPDSYGNTVNIVMNFFQEEDFNQKPMSVVDTLVSNCMNVLSERLRAFQNESYVSPLDLACIESNKAETRQMREADNYGYKKDAGQ